MKIFILLFFLLPAFTVTAQLKAYRDKDVTAFFKRTSGAVAMDGGFTIPLADNRVLWLFGDTYIDHYDSLTKTVPCLFQVRNSALLQPADHSWQWQQTETLMRNKNKTESFFINGADDGIHYIWTLDGIQIKDTVFVLCLNMKNVQGGMGFDNAGPPAWAKITFPQMQPAGFSALPDFKGLSFGYGFVADSAAGVVYVYGSRGNGMAGDIVVAQFNMSNPYSWQFWNGQSWDNDAKNCASIGKVPSFSQHISKVRNKYLLLTAEFSLSCDNGKAIYAATSDLPTGPFSAPKQIYIIDDTLQGHYPFWYLPIAHPEFINDKNELLINYSINGYGKCIEACVDGRYDPEFYRPQAIRVPLKLIDEGFE